MTRNSPRDGMLLSCERCPFVASRRFCDFSREEMDFISSLKTGELKVPSGATIMSEGAPNAHLYTVVSGWGFRYKTLPDGRRQILNYFMPGDLIGLQGVLMGDMEHSVEALTPVSLCVFERRSLMSIYRNQPKLAYDLTWMAAREERLLDENLLSVGQRTALERTAYLLAYLHQRGRNSGLMQGKFPSHSAYPAARGRHARPFARPHQQDAAQACRPRADPLARPRMRNSRRRTA